MFGSIRNFVWRKKAEQALDEELRSCVDLLARERIEQGMAPAEARRQALIELGGVAQVQEQVRDVRGLPRLETLLRETRFALRNLARAPGLSLTVIVTLGLAIGANCAVFAVLDRLVLRPLPVKDPQALVIVKARPIPTRGSMFMMGGRSAAGFELLSYPLYRRLRDGVAAFEGVIAEMGLNATLQASGDPMAVKALLVSGNYFQVLGVRAAAGRLFAGGDEGSPGSSPYAVLSDGFWRRQFGADPSVLGRTIRLNQFPLTVIGVSAAGFTGTVAGEAPDVLLPVNMRDELVRHSGRMPLRYDSPDMHVYKVMARLGPGMTLPRAEQTADAQYRQMVEESLGDDGYWTRTTQERLAAQHLTLIPGGRASNDQSALGRDLKTPVALLMALVALVLFVAAGNVANLFLARGAARRAEISIRLALGSTRWRVLRQFLLEILLLSLASGALGLLAARWAAGLAPALLNFERTPDIVAPATDWRVSLAALALALLTGLGVWAASALQVSRQWGVRALAEDVKDARNPRAPWGRRLLVVAQVSLSLMLLCASMVLSRSLVRLMALDPGFSLDGLYSFTLRPDQAGYEGARRQAYLGLVTEKVRAIPGVVSVAVTNTLPAASEHSGSFLRADRSDRTDVVAVIVDVGAGYFASLGAGLAAGRDFTPAEVASGANLVLVNESLARKLFPRGALERLVGLDGEPTLRVIGVVKDLRASSRAAVRPTVYRPLAQAGRGGPVSFVIRSAGGAALPAEAVREAVRGVDAAVAIVDFSSLRSQFSRLLYRDRMLAFLSSGFAALAALLCAIGVFGLTTFSAQRRTQEFGVRLALGATRRSIEWLVMKDVGALAVAGCATGLAGFAAANQILSTVLFELSPGDPASVAIAGAVLMVTVSVAGFVPAVRAAHRDPASTLRRE